MLKVAPTTISTMMDSLHYHVHHFSGTTTTVAIAVLPNGFTVGIGKSGCLDPDAFDATLGENMAIDNARKAAENSLWELEGYRIKPQ